MSNSTCSQRKRPLTQKQQEVEHQQAQEQHQVMQVVVQMMMLCVASAWTLLRSHMRGHVAMCFASPASRTTCNQRPKGKESRHLPPGICTVWLSSPVSCGLQCAKPLLQLAQETVGRSWCAKSHSIHRKLKCCIDSFLLW